MKRMREIRRASGITLEECARRAGVQVQRWCRWERAGWVPSPEIACTVADVLGTSIDKLCDRTERVESMPTAS